MRKRFTAYGAVTGGVLVVAGLINGCARTYLPEERALLHAAADETKSLDPLDLVARSDAAPIPLDNAAERLLEQVVEPSPPSPDAMELTVADVRAAALQNNLDLQVELFNRPIAEAAAEEERAKFEWIFFGSASTSETDSPTVLATESSQAEFDSYNLGLSVPLRTGGTATVSLPFNRQETNNPFSLLNPAHNADARFSLSHPLLRNAGVRTNTHSIRVAEFQQGITSARTKLEAIRVLANADRAYWNLYAARGELDVRFREYELAMEQLERARRRVEAGDAPEIEITRAESGVAGSLEAIIVARALVERRQRDLKRLMNLPNVPMNSPTSLLTQTAPSPTAFALDADSLAAFAIENRMEMLELELQIAIDASTVDLQRNARLPLVTLDYSYGFGGLGTSRDAAFDQLGSGRFVDWSLGVNTEIPIGNQQAKARLSQAVLQRLQRLATREQRAQAIEQEVRDALDVLHQNWQRILAARIESRLAGETLEAEQRQFDVGVRTSTDVLDAAARLSDAQSREVRAMADYQIALIDLAFATGTLLGHDAIVWPTQ